MFEVVELDLSGQWHTPTIGEIAELLVFYDKVSIRAPLARLIDLMPDDLDSMSFLRALVESGRISFFIDQFPLGEIAQELGLLDSGWGRSEPDQLRERIRRDYPQVRTPPYRRSNDRPWVAEWERIMARTYDPFQVEKGYPDSLIDRAVQRMATITEPAFLTTALDAFGSDMDAAMHQALTNVQTYETRFEGRDLIGLKIDVSGGGANLLQFLSQSNALIEGFNSGDRDTYSSASFDNWTRRFAVGAAQRLGVREDLDGFRKLVTTQSSVAQVIDAGAKRFRDIEALLEAREPLGAIVRGRAADESITEAYFKEISAKTWANSGNGKIVRVGFWAAVAVGSSFALTPAGGAIVGVVGAAVDGYVVDRIFKGNAGRTFIDDKLKPFIKPD